MKVLQLRESFHLKPFVICSLLHNILILGTLCMQLRRSINEIHVTVQRIIVQVEQPKTNSMNLVLIFSSAAPM